jgi:hypothetical protein
MNLINSIRNYCIRRIIKKGKEQKVYSMLLSANYRFAVVTHPVKIELAEKGALRASRLIETYNINSKRVREQVRKCLELFIST